MQTSDYALVAGGTNICSEYGAVISTFAETLPEPKVIKVDIPAGADLDITEALGAMGYHNGTHTLGVLVKADTETARRNAVRAIVALLHGKRLDYQLTWDSGYTFTGRFAVAVERRSPLASWLTITSDRSPWKRHSREQVIIDCHPSASYTLQGSERYHTLYVIMQQAGTTKVGDEAAVTRDAAGTYTLAADVYGDTEVTVTVADWLMYVDEPNLKVKSGKISYSGTNAVIDASYTVTSGNMVFPDADDQKVTVRFYRWDL